MQKYEAPHVIDSKYSITLQLIHRQTVT